MSLEAIRGVARVSEAARDFSAAAEACRQEANILTDPRRVATLWSRSARLRSRGGETALHQFEDLERSIGTWPDDDSIIEVINRNRQKRPSNRPND